MKLLIIHCIKLVINMASQSYKNKGKNAYLINYGLRTDEKCKRVNFYNKKLRQHVKNSVQKYLDEYLVDLDQDEYENQSSN